MAAEPEGSDDHPAGRSRWDAARRDLLVAAGGFALVAVCGVGAASGRVGTAELAVLHAVNGLPDAIAPPMQAAQPLG